MKEFFIPIALVIIALFGSFLAGGTLGMRFGTEKTQNEAVDRGVGAWSVDKSGEKTFAWHGAGACKK